MPNPKKKIIVKNTISTTRLYPNLVEAVVEGLKAVFDEGIYADKVVETLLKRDARWGSRDRAFVAETLYDTVRWFRKWSFPVKERSHHALFYWWVVGIGLMEKGVKLPDWKEFDEVLLMFPESEYWDGAEAAVLQSVPDWMYAQGTEELGDKWPRTLKALNEQAAVVLRTNTLITDRKALQKALAEEEVMTQPVGPNGLVVTQRRNLFQTLPFRNGWFEVQDYSSQLVAPALSVAPGMRVIDACAGAGGKALHLASLMQNKGHIIALDTEAYKLDTLKKRAKRAKAHIIETRAITSTKVIKRLAGTADRLLLDVPCSGMGVLKRNPDAKWKLKPAFLENIRVTQQEILQSYSRMLKPGGQMVYATCSIFPSENERQVEQFLATNAGFELISQRSILPQDDGYDGFFIAQLQFNG